MTYAVIATYKLPASMAGSTICEVYLGRFNGFSAALEVRDDHEKQHPDLVISVLRLLENDLDMQPLHITYHVRHEE